MTYTVFDNLHEGHKMARKPRETLTRTLRQAILTDEKTMYAVAKSAKVHYATLSRFMSSERVGITLQTAGRIAAVLDLELRPKRKGGG